MKVVELQDATDVIYRAMGDRHTQAHPAWPSGPCPHCQPFRDLVRKLEGHAFSIDGRQAKDADL